MGQVDDIVACITTLNVDLEAFYTHLLVPSIIGERQKSTKEKPS